MAAGSMGILAQRMAQMAVEIKVEQFELAIAADGDAMLSFIGRARVSSMAGVLQRDEDVLVERGALPPLCFTNFRPEDLEYLASAERIFVTRMMPGGSFEFTQVKPLSRTET